MPDSSFKDPMYDNIEAGLEKKYNLPEGGMRAIRTLGERSNSNQVSSAGAKSVYQIIPATRNGILKQYGVDAYASPEAAAESSALILRDSLRRNRGDWTAAVAEYNGGTSKSRQNNAETKAYVSRVTGKPMVIPAGENGATQLAPGVNMDDFSYDDLKDVAPEDLGSRRPLGPQAPVDKPDKQQTLTNELVGGRNLIPTRGDQRPDLHGEITAEAGAVKDEKERAAVTFTDKVAAATDKNWILNQMIRGFDREHYQEDPAFHDFYLKNAPTIEKFAETPDERDQMREATSAADLARITGEITTRRELDKAIHAGGSLQGTALELGSSLVDPVALLATGGIGKLGQIASKGYTVGRAAIEGAAFNLGATGALDFSGVHQDASDYAFSGVAGLALGAALYPLTKPSGAVDRSLLDHAAGMTEAEHRAARDLADNAAGLAGPNATPEQVAAKHVDLTAKRPLDAMHVMLGDVGNENKFLTADKDNILLGTKNAVAGEIKKSELGAMEDTARQAVVAEYTARSRALVEANPVNQAGLQGKVLPFLGQESTGATMLRSDSDVMKAASMLLTEGTTGAGGRRTTAALQQVGRERVYMRDMVEYEPQFEMWRKAQGIGKLKSEFDPSVRKQFDREIFYETVARQDMPEGYRVTSNNAVAAVVDAQERGYARMAADQKHVSTLGSARLADNSRGYLPQKISSLKVMKLKKTAPAQYQEVENILAKQFNTNNEYSYVVKETGEKITKNFDKAFSKKLAKRYLHNAVQRGNGRLDVPMNLSSPDAADIVSDAIKGMQGMAKEDQEALLGKFSRGGAGYTKSRLKLDMTAPLADGTQLGDLFNQDILGLYRGYARRSSGEVALAQFGIYGRHGLDLLHEAASLTGATADELKALEQVSAEFLNTPFKGAKRHAFMDNVRIATSAARLGGMAFTQVGESANGIAALGVGRVMSSLASAPALVKDVRRLAEGKPSENNILKSIDPLIGPLGTDGYQMTRIFDLPDNEVQLYTDHGVGVVGQALRRGSHMVSVMSGHRIVNAVQTRGMAEQIIRKAVHYIKNGKEDIALKDMGFTPEIQSAMKASMDKIATFNKKGKLVNLDIMGGGLAPEHIRDIATSVERGASQIIQRAYIGETGPWAHDDFLKLLFQFRTFSLTSIEKQWGRNQTNYGALKSFATMMGAMSFALPIHMARLELQMVGKSDADRKKFADERMNAIALGRATLNYASAAGLLGDTMDIGSSFANNLGLLDKDTAAALTGGGQGRQSASGIVPGLGMVDDVLKGTVGAQPMKLVKLLPGANLPFVTPFINGVSPDKQGQ